MTWVLHKLALLLLTSFAMSWVLYTLFWFAAGRLIFGFQGLEEGGFTPTRYSQSLLTTLPLGEGYATWLGLLPQEIPLGLKLHLEEPVRHVLYEREEPVAEEWLLVLMDLPTGKPALYSSGAFPLRNQSSTLPAARTFSEWQPLSHWKLQDSPMREYQAIESRYQGLLQGYGGYSLTFQRPITDLLKARLPVTFSLGFITLLLAYPLSLPLAYLITYCRPHTRILETFSLLLFSAPGVILGLCLIWLFSWKLNWFPLQVLPWWYWRIEPLRALRALINPALSLGIPLLITNSLLISRRLAESLSQDYVLFARAKGLSSWRIARTHLLKVSLAPLVVRTKNALLLLMSGSLVTENLFGVAGVGQLSLQALLNNDLMLALALAHLIMIIQLVGQFITEGVLALWYPSPS